MMESHEEYKKYVTAKINAAANKTREEGKLLMVSITTFSFLHLMTLTLRCDL